MTHMTYRDNRGQLSRLVRAVFTTLARSPERGIHAVLVIGFGMVLVIVCRSTVTIGDEAPERARMVVDHLLHIS